MSSFHAVYEALLEVFPEVDPRILKVVAKENPEDVDAAMEVVLAEILPYLSVHGGFGASFSDQAQSVLNPYEDVQASDIADRAYSAGPNDGVYEEVTAEHFLPRKPEESSRVECGMSYLNLNGSSPNTGADEDNDSAYVDASGEKMLTDTDGLEDSSLYEELSSSVELVRNNFQSVTQVNGVDPSLLQIMPHDSPESSCQLVTEPVSLATKVVESKADVSCLTVVGKDVPTSEDMVDVVLDISIKELEKQEANGADSSLFSEIDGFEDEQSMKAIGTSDSGQMSTTELLEDFIENEKNEKIALCSAKESLLRLSNEVDLKEKSVCKAREEAAQGGLNTFASVEDLKKIVHRAKEANDMNAGEVYGEKAILATETRELRSRLHCLSEERVKALAILDEIRQVLEMRLILAEKEIKEAENQKLKKEESALIDLAHEESSMEEVVQKSKILQQQAEENSKIREFLMDRGRVVDVLQGELSVICQDVQLMKAKFDQRIPLSKSLSSSQFTSISTCTSSPAVDPFSDKVPEVVVSPENQKESLSNSPVNQLLREDEVPSTGEELVDDDWELCEDSVYSASPVIKQ